MLIKELVKIDVQGNFIPAIQLSDYDDPKINLLLTKTYIFADSAPDIREGEQRVVGSIQLLKEIRLSYVNSSPVNRLVVIANYGHGKSHLGLVLANYFAKSYSSDEVQAILGRIEMTLSHNLPEAQNFRDFKKEYDQFLVVRLRGDTPRTLREQFFPALQKALQEHSGTKKVELPFWNQAAKKWLESKLDDKQAKNYLSEKYGTSVSNLIQEVEENEQGAYEQYVELFTYLNNGVPPSAEGHFSLQEAVVWVVDKFCKNAKPLAGLVVLFDEFSQFIENYSQSNATGDLQDLLNGIGDRRGKAMFLAFAQHDPNEVAERQQSGQTLQSIQRELGRIDRKYALYSLMESVLHAYLDQTESNWDKFLQQTPRVKGSIYGQTTEMVWDIYNKRYDKELRWTNDKFREVVVKGCFPLHPLTTALLCHLKMQQGLDDDPRTILKFVRDRFEAKQNENVLKGEKINWILPIDLVDYFDKRIMSEQNRSAYETATSNLEQAFGDTVTQAQRDVLRALLLQVTDGINKAGAEQIELLSEMSGLDRNVTLDTLKVLGKNNITRYYESNQFNTFWPVSVNPKALEQKIRGQTDGRKFGEDELIELNRILPTLILNANRIEVNVDWGTPSDWAADAKLITRTIFDKEHIGKLVVPYHLSFKGFQEGCRGFVGWLFALDDDDLTYFAENADKVMKEVCIAETPLPVLFVIPQKVNKKIAEQFLRHQALEKMGRDKDVLKEVGQNTYDTEFLRAKAELTKAIADLFDDKENYASIKRKPNTIVVPSAYKPSLATLATFNIQSILQKLYALAYPYRPPEFFTDLPAAPKKGASPLRDAVKTVAKNLICNSIGSAISGMTPVARDRICQQQLINKWHLLSTTFWIQEPEVLSLKHAWDFLDEQVKPDEEEISVKTFIPKLFVPPFGFDYNTALLLITAWIGKNNKELQFCAKNKIIKLGDLENLIQQEHPRDFLSKICTEEALTFSRRDANKVLTEGHELLESIHKGEMRDQDAAEDQLAKLNEIVIQCICDESEKEDFEQGILVLQTALDDAKRYDQGIKNLITSIAGESNLYRLLALSGDIKNISVPTLVLASQPPLAETQEKLEAQISAVVDAVCKKAEELNRLEGGDAVRDVLRDYKSALKQRPELVAKLSLAEDQLTVRIQEIKNLADEEARQNQINAMSEKADLITLYEYLEVLEAISEGSPSLAKLIKQKIGAVSRAIDELEIFAKNSIKVVGDLNQKESNILYDAILQNENRYAGSKYDAALQEVKQKIKTIRVFFSDLQMVENLSLRTPDDIEEARGRIKKIITDHGKQIGKKQKGAIKNILEDIEQQEQKEYAKSEMWIADLEKEFKKEKTSEIRAKLLKAPAFLSQEVRTRVDLLDAELKKREFDESQLAMMKKTEDLINHIEYMFKSISDPKKRKECLERLKKLE